jgi:tetratricopeptide (TPR) repeat protein
MPSLKNLDAFAGLFRSVGNEAGILAEREEEPNAPELPDREPEPLPLDDNGTGLLDTGDSDKAVPAPAEEEPRKDIPPDREAPPEAPSALDGLDSTGPDALSDDEGAGIVPDFDFGSFAQPADEDLSPLSIDDALPEDFAEPEAPAESAEETAESREPPDAATVPEDIDLGDFADLFEDAVADNEDAVADSESAAADADSEDVLPDRGNTAADADIGDVLPDIEDLVPDVVDMADIEYAAPDTADAAAGETGEGFPPLEEPDTQEGTTGPNEDTSVIEDPFAVEQAPSAPETAPDSGSFDDFDLVGSETSDRDKADAPDSGDADFPGLDDFVIPGIDVPAEAAPAAGPGKDAGQIPDAAKSAVNAGEDMTLTDEEFALLEETLHGYPLNLRVACEEAIAQADTPSAQLSQLVKLLVRGGAARDAAKLAGKILNKDIVVPRGYQKKTGAELEAEQASFAYIFVKKFLPMLGFFLFVAGAIAGTVYLGWNFVYKPLKAESIYKIGIERIAAGEYERANERFNEAWRWKPVKEWFYTYAEAFRDARQYFYAEEKYEQLIAYTAMLDKKGIPEKQGVLDYARMETDYLRNYEKADRILRTHILDWNPDDSDGLLALGDVNMAWGDSNVEFSDEDARDRDGGKYEVARQNYARHLEIYGWNDPVLERMLRYFIRADNLSEILPLQEYFMAQKKLTIRPATLTELGAYLLDKQTEQTRYVRDANVENIEGVRDILLRSADADPLFPETHYHLARYYAMLGERNREQQYLDNASSLFDGAREESAGRIRARIDTEQRAARLSRDRRAFFAAEERLVKAASLYEDAIERRVFRPSPRFGSIYADLGDLAYFTQFSEDSQPGNWREAITYYLRAEESGYSATEMHYRLGSSYYHLSDFRRAEERFFRVSTETPPNRRVLHALGNVSFLRGNFSAAESYFSRLVSMLQAGRLRITDFSADENPAHRDLIERLMIAQNNLGAVYQTLAERDGRSPYRTRALALYSDASRIWDNLSRDRATFTRPGLADLSIPTVSLPYLNTANTLYPVPAAKPEIFITIDRDMLEPSPWDTLAPAPAGN